MSEKFKSSNYVDILRSISPEIDSARNPLDLGLLKNLPSLKNIVLLSDTKVNGMLNFKDILNFSTSIHEKEMHDREREIEFQDATNIQFTSGTTGYPKGATLSHHNILNNALYIGDFMKV
jgi:fatty-acyl-CoA synthase